MKNDTRSNLARKLDYYGARMLLFFSFTLLFTRIFPPVPGVILAGAVSYFLHRGLRSRHRRHLTQLAQQRLRSKWREERKGQLASLGPRELASWASPYLVQLGLTQPACPLERPGIQLEAYLGKSPVAVAIITNTQPITKSTLVDSLNSLPRKKDEKILFISSGPFTLEAHRWSQTQGKDTKILEGEKLLDLAWQGQREEVTGERAQSAVPRKPATLGELQQFTRSRIIYGLHSSLYLVLWALTLRGRLQYYYFTTAVITAALLLYNVRLLVHYRSLGSPNWEGWLKVKEK